MAGKSSKSKLKKAAKAAKRAGELAKQAEAEQLKADEAVSVSHEAATENGSSVSGGVSSESGEAAGTVVRIEEGDVSRSPSPAADEKRSRLAPSSVNKKAQRTIAVAGNDAPWHPYRDRFLAAAAICLCIAAAVGALLVIAGSLLLDGEKALHAILGLQVAITKPLTARLMIVFDTLLPVYYGAGLALLAAAFQTRGTRPIVRITLTVLMLAVAADFAENAIVFNGMMGASNKGIHLPFSFAKYGLLAFGCILLSILLTGTSALSRLVVILLRYVIPISTAILVSGLNSSFGILASVAGLPVLFLLLAWFSMREINR